MFDGSRYCICGDGLRLVAVRTGGCFHDCKKHPFGGLLASSTKDTVRTLAWFGAESPNQKPGVTNRDKRAL
jgi:hypothetical protein